MTEMSWDIMVICILAVQLATWGWFALYGFRIDQKVRCERRRLADAFAEAKVLIEYGAAKEGIDLLAQALAQEDGEVSGSFLSVIRKVRVAEASVSVPPLSSKRS
jgi:hypothetical protein